MVFRGSRGVLRASVRGHDWIAYVSTKKVLQSLLRLVWLIPVHCEKDSLQTEYGNSVSLENCVGKSAALVPDPDRKNSCQKLISISLKAGLFCFAQIAMARYCNKALSVLTWENGPVDNICRLRTPWNSALLVFLHQSGNAHAPTRVHMWLP